MNQIRRKKTFVFAGAGLGALFILFSVFPQLASSDVQVPPPISEAMKKRIKPEKVEIASLYEDEHSRTVLTPYGNYFRMAKDRSLEKIGELIMPIELDSYIYIKFGDLREYLDSKFSQLEAQLNRIEQTLSETQSALEAIKNESEESIVL